MLQVTMADKTYLLAAEATMEQTKQAVLDAVRAAPAFLSLRTVLDAQVEVLVTPASTVVLAQHDDAPLLPATSRDGFAENEYEDLYGLDYV
ncbi:hypothetical protein EDF36_2417 [Rathayibacter sp. PhB152]|uniref:hypothetical protein n=1 Tax=Rathayibacter sp. PhB152 TaxID=2485190 RepID=UPI000F4B8C02|nr:hypothetical protein [Rathayibacter sp. PhB152]ROQ58962.1 hypothetical protein EDF36_2417 [Rathayibacter sp. PhB152]